MDELPKSVLFGLIGKPVKHSFSKDYFSQKFSEQGLIHFSYELFELDNIAQFTELLQQYPQLKGLNVTLPYKKQVLPYLDWLSPEAARIGAVNTIKVESSRYSGFNTDYFGFKQSLLQWADKQLPDTALVLGQGGASAAVLAALEDLDIKYLIATRNPRPPAINYQQLDELNLAEFPLIINTTPLGMAPNTDQAPPINYHQINALHFVYDLVYNPVETMLMKLCDQQGAQVKNGLDMLHLQAEKAWEIWTA